MTASCSKLGIESLSTAEEVPGPVLGNRIIDHELIVEAFAQLCCPKCFAEKVELFEDYTKIRLVIKFRIDSSQTAYKNQEEKLLKVVQEVAEESIIKAATEIVEKKQNLSSNIVKCGISVDGTWQRRGYTSMNGCVAAITVDTGKMLDIEVMSSYCPTCKRLQTMPRNFEYESSKADHICQCNFTGSSSKMEIVGASRILLRSEKNRRLQYTQYYGDGDSKAFMSVKDTYGLNCVTKCDCIDHVQKKVGSRLRKLKTKTKGLSGKGKLTDNFIDRHQNYYGIAVRSNVGNLIAMQQNVIAALYHCASSDKKPMNGQCLIGKESWCYFQRGWKMEQNVPQNMLVYQMMF
ncbi:CCHC-type domain-containing protein [Trichonephila clavipes]|nr:CCHC-type domain-containing protein [Trichonephila clavipes]